jgi:hypothetical protein
LIRDLIEANPGTELIAVLIGSVARHRETANSDIDMLVIGMPRPTPVRTAPPFHVQCFGTEEFRRKLAAGDDFAAWCIRFGSVLLGQEPWLRLRRLPEAEHWPTWNTKVAHAYRRLIFSWELLGIDDLPASQEELMYAFSHIARALLLKSRLFPFSRPELPEQIEAMGQHRVARVLRDLCASEFDKGAIRRHIVFAKRLLVALDRDLYRRCSREYQAKKIARVTKSKETIGIPSNGHHEIRRIRQ